MAKDQKRDILMKSGLVKEVSFASTLRSKLLWMVKIYSFSSFPLVLKNGAFGASLRDFVGKFLFLYLLGNEAEEDVACSFREFRYLFCFWRKLFLRCFLWRIFFLLGEWEASYWVYFQHSLPIDLTSPTDRIIFNYPSTLLKSLCGSYAILRRRTIQLILLMRCQHMRNKYLHGGRSKKGDWIDGVKFVMISRWCSEFKKSGLFHLVNVRFAASKQSKTNISLERAGPTSLSDHQEGEAHQEIQFQNKRVNYTHQRSSVLRMSTWIRRESSGFTREEKISFREQKKRNKRKAQQVPSTYIFFLRFSSFSRFWISFICIFREVVEKFLLKRQTSGETLAQPAIMNWKQNKLIEVCWFFGCFFMRN